MAKPDKDDSGLPPGTGKLKDPVLIVTCGRSGSTLLQGLLNGIEGYLVKGENHGFLHGLYMAHLSLSLTKRFATQATALPTHSWFGAGDLDPDQFLQQARTLALSTLFPEAGTNPNITRFGFKEIRYFALFKQNSKESEKVLTHYLDFLHELLGGVRFIMLRRNPADISNSSWWKNSDSSVLIPELTSFHAALARYTAKNPDFCLMVDYEALVSSMDSVRAIYQFLGEDDKFDSAKVAQLINKKHGY